MAKIYLSATYADLKAHRDAVYRILRMLRHDVISMEDYVATDAYPLHKCLADVASCDVYVGLVGWRYGYIPDRDNPENKSITELEYDQAGKSRLPRIMFLADRQAPWPDEFRDSETGEGDSGQRIAAFRGALEQATLVSYFRTPDHLAGLVSTAVQRCLKEKPVTVRFSGPVRVELSRRLGDSWRDLASYMDIPAYDVARFERGDEARAMLTWLENRRRQAELPDALKAIGRRGLAELFDDE